MTPKQLAIRDYIGELSMKHVFWSESSAISEAGKESSMIILKTLHLGDVTARYWSTISAVIGCQPHTVTHHAHSPHEIPPEFTRIYDKEAKTYTLRPSKA